MCVNITSQWRHLMFVKFGVFVSPSRHVECATFSKSPSDSSSPEIAWCFVETRMWWNMKTPEGWNQHEWDDLKSITQKLNPQLFSTFEYKIERFVSEKLRIKIDFTALCLLQSWAFWKKNCQLFQPGSIHQTNRPCTKRTIFQVSTEWEAQLIGMSLYSQTLLL